MSSPQAVLTDEQPRPWEDVVRLLTMQNEILQMIVTNQKDSAEQNGQDRRDLSKVLREIGTRNAIADLSRQAVAEVPATSSSAWAPLLNSQIDTMHPTVDRWRGTLDTLLIFVALFSAIVTAFFVQSLEGLSPDPASRTNELLVNLTEIFITLSVVNSSELSFSPPSSFEPESSAVRLNFYWSISLILSISVASLAVSCRGYVSMLSRSDHTQAHKKLGDLYRRWKEATRLLSPTIQTLPQLLIIPVILFIMGLLDSMISSALPVSRASLPVFVAGVTCIAFSALVGFFTVYTLLHGCLYPSTSPFQSTLSVLLSKSRPGYAILALFAYCFSLRRAHCLSPRRPSATSTRSGRSSNTWVVRTEGVGRHLSKDDRSPRFHVKLEPFEFDAYHMAIQTLHDDDLLDRAVAALGPIMLQRLPSLEHRLIVASRPEVDTLSYLLSSEVSLRSNLTAAAIIQKCIEERESSNGFYFSFVYREQLFPLLRQAATRYAFATSGTEHNPTLWGSPFTSAMALTLLSRHHKRQESWHTWGLCSADPVLAIMFFDFTESHSSLCMMAMEYTSQVLLSKLREVDHRLTLKWSESSSFDAAFNIMMSSEDLRHFRQRFHHESESITNACMARFVVSASFLIRDSSDFTPVLEGFLRWLTRERNPTSLVLQVTDVLHMKLHQVNQCGHNVLHWFHILWRGLLEHRTQSLDGASLTVACIKTVNFLCAIDHSPAQASGSPRTFYPICGQSWGSSTICSALCAFHDIFLHIIRRIKAQSLKIQLTGQTWRDLVWNLEGAYRAEWIPNRNAPLPQGPMSREWSSSTREHQDRIRTDILDAFSPLMWHFEEDSGDPAMNLNRRDTVIETETTVSSIDFRRSRSTLREPSPTYVVTAEPEITSIESSQSTTTSGGEFFFVL